MTDTTTPTPVPQPEAGAQSVREALDKLRGLLTDERYKREYRIGVLRAINQIDRALDVASLASDASPSAEVELREGWLKRDVEKAAARVAEWDAPSSPSAEPVGYVSTYHLADLRNGVGKDYVPLNREPRDEAVALYATPPAPAATAAGEVRRPDTVRDTFDYYVAESRENGICKMPLRVAEDMALGYSRQARHNAELGNLVENYATRAKALDEIEGILSEGQCDDNGSQILPDFEPGWSIVEKVEACIHLLEKRRDVIAAALAPPPTESET